MKKAVLSLLPLLLFSAFALSQTTYSVTQDSCNGKAAQFCTLPVVDQNSQPSTVVFDTRAASCCRFYIGGFGIDGHTGPQIGFGVNPDGTLNDFTGLANWASTDGLVTASLTYRGHYVSTCSGRACGGVIGWHYTILAGSTVVRN